MKLAPSPWLRRSSDPGPRPSTEAVPDQEYTLRSLASDGTSTSYATAVSTSPWASPLLPALVTPSPWALSPLLPGPYAAEQQHGCVATMTRHAGHVYAVAVCDASSSSGVLYTASESTNIRAWDISQTIPRDGHGHGDCFGAGSGHVKAIVTAADGSVVFTAHGDRKIRVWGRRRDADGGAHRHLATLPTTVDRVRRGVNPANYVRVRRHRRELWIRHVDVISCLALDSRRGLLYSASWDKTIKSWRLTDWRCLSSVNAHQDAVNAIAVAATADGSVFSASADGTVKFWTARGGALQMQQVMACSGSVNTVAVSEDGRFLYGGTATGHLHVWRRTWDIDAGAERMKKVGTLAAHSMAVLCLSVVGDTIFCGSADKTITAWRPDGAGHVRFAVLGGHSGPVKCMAATAASGGGGFVVYSGSLDRSVKVWVLHDGGRVGTPALSPAALEEPVLLSPAWIRDGILHQ